MRIGVINSLRPERENCIFDRVRDMGLKTCQVSSWNSAYLSAELVDEQGDLVAFATSTWKALKPDPARSPAGGS